ncbi:MAG: alkaline phosphatase family protein, partial [Acidimicrobiales bacterium]
HPSLPNYLALVSGGTWGVTSDCVTCYLNRPNLGAQLSAAHVSWDAYVEGIPSPCFLAPYGGVDYAAKHNPWRYFESVRSSRSVCSHLRPLSDLAPTLAKPASSVPDFVWVTPDLCHDGHDCSTAVAAAWLTGFVNEVTSSSAFRAGGALFVTFDEGVGNAGVSPRGEVSATSGGGRVATILISAATRPGSTYSRPANHYSLLATVDQIFGLARLGHARGAATLTKMFNKTASLTG